ncbi:histidine kinase [Streptosporangium fragile]|uniref:histidine kinase n=1 Tax=Streptosporangium fragile TaxID=46186 RepID=A0ABP6I6I6_9ACTN
MTDPGTRRHRVEDVLLWAGLCLPVLWGVLTSAAGGYAWWEPVAEAALLAVAVAASRRRPPVAVLVAAACWAVSIVSRDGSVLGVAAFPPTMVVTSYLAGVRTAEVWPVLSGLLGASATVVVLAPLLAGEPGAGFTAGLTGIAGIALFGVVPWLVGRHRRQSLHLARVGWDHAERLEHEQLMIAEQARSRERTRIAEDMHDLLGHELSLIALRVGGLEVAPGLDERYREAAGEARRAVTAASERLREIVEVLHGDCESAGPEPGRQDVVELVRRARASGVPVELRLEGRVAPPPMVERTAYRVVREALTNAAKHARGALVRVTLDHRDGETHVTVTNDLVPADRGEARAGGGLGLVGLAERVRLGGGSFRAGERDGVFELVARVPHVPGRVAATGEARTAPPSRSAVRLAEERRRVRRTRLTAVAAALVAGTGVTAAVLGYMTYDAVTSTLRPADFERLRVGRELAEVRAVLPARTRVESPARTGPEPPAPAGAVCRYYSTHGNPFDGRRHDLYRLCFSGGRLASKDFLPGDGAGRGSAPGPGAESGKGEEHGGPSRTGR